MQTTFGRTLILCLLCFLQFAATASAQSKRPAVTKIGEHPSHRRLPLADGKNKPKLQNFLNDPEFKELQKHYRKLRQEENAMRKVDRLPGESIREALDREKKLVDFLDRSFLPVDSNDIEFEIKSVFESLGKSLGEGLAETLEPESVEFNAKDTASWDPTIRLQEEIARRTNEAKGQFKEAEKLFKETWPTDSVAPDEWFRKVQPFINSEVIEQLTEVSRQFNAQSDVPPKERRFQNIEKIPPIVSRDESSNMFDSLMNSIDKQGTDWLKSSEKEKSSLWKSLRQSAQNGIKSLNRSMTENSQRQANAPGMQPSSSISGSKATPGSSAQPNNQARSNPSSSTPAETNHLWLWVTGVAALLGVSALAYWYRDKLVPTHEPHAKDPLLASRIQDRDSLLKACHLLARQLFGARSRFWNHRKLFDNLSKNVSEHSTRGQNIVDQLSQIYEAARYAPVRPAASEFSRARDLFASLQNDLQTSA